MSLANGTTLGPYIVVSQLGEGGMGEIYQARDPRLGRDVAIKVLPDHLAQDKEALARFQRESTAIAALSHPNIRAIHDVGTDKGRTFAVMELLEGETLASRLERGPLGWQKSVQTARAIADGLAAAHDKGIIHRDMKPKNIFLTPEGGVKVLDFGLALLDTRHLEQKEDTTTTPMLKTQPGMVLGTAAYMSPEQVRGQPADARSDIFSVGSVLYEMLAGNRAFLRESVVETMMAVLNDDPPDLAESGAVAPGELHRVVMHCLEKNPARRFQSARDLAFALAGVEQRMHIEEYAQRTSTVSPLRLDAELPRSGNGRKASVAVLPFVNMSSDQENEYFSDGLAEELINALCKIDGLHVASRTSAFAFKGRSEDIRRIGDRLNVRTVLEGSVRKAGNRLRITAQLVNVSDGYHLWSEVFDRQMEDVFAVQNEIANAIAGALQLVLNEKTRRAISQVPTNNAQAYEYYLSGRQLLHRFRKTAVERARRMFLRAFEIDPQCAGAYAGVADCCSLLHSYWGASNDHLREADEASRKALELEPDLAQAHVARGLAVSLNKRYDEAQEEFEAAIRLDPELFDAYYFYARACYEQGKLEQAVTLFEQASRVNPEDYQAPSLAATVYVGLARKSEAEAASRRALAAVKRYLELYPDDGRALYMGAIISAHRGDHQRALEWAQCALTADPEEPLVVYNVACTYAVLGRTEQAIDCVERAIELGGTWREWIGNDPDLNSLRDHPRFKTLLGRP